MPIRGSRHLYKIPQIQVGEDATGAGGRAIVVKMKEPIADLLSLEKMPWNDPDLVGTFGGSGPNAGYKFIKRVGGYRFVSYTVVARQTFLISELIQQPDGNYNAVSKRWKSFTIGFPKGVSVREFKNWIAQTGILGEIDRIITPSGVAHPMGPAAP